MTDENIRRNPNLAIDMVRENPRKYIFVRKKELATAYNLFVGLRCKTNYSTSTLTPRTSQSRIIKDVVHH